MELISYEEENRIATIELTDFDLCDIAACIGYLVNTFDKQDSVLLSLPGEQGCARVSELDDKIHKIIKKINQSSLKKADK